jgi:hypothetical protein
MARRACLSIGVSTVLAPQANQKLNFEYLDGAISAARSIGEWALKSRYGADNVRVVEDSWLDGRPNPVTRQRLQAAVNELFPSGAEPVEHLLLSFCGHGLTDANIGSLSWLLSDSLQGKYRVKADSFYGELRFLPIKRITLLSDACREAPTGLDLLRLDGVRGIVVQGSEASMKLDRLSACQDGALGYMVKESTLGAPGKCLFSGVLLDALWGQEPAAIDNGRITTSTLAACVRDRTAARAAMYRLTLNPEVSVDPEPATIFDEANPPIPPHSLQPWPAPAAAAVLGAQPGSMTFTGAVASLEVDTLKKLGLPGLVPSQAELRKKDERVVERNLAAASVPAGANLLIHGSPLRLWSATTAQRLPGTDGFTAFWIDAPQAGSQVLVEFEDGRCVPVTIYPRLYAVVTLGDSGAVFQAYGDPYGSSEAYLDAVSAITEFACGVIGVNMLDSLAGTLRMERHADPTLGAICAHLYRLSADYDSIRRMAYLYEVHDQPVPFEVALLGAMRVTRAHDGQFTLDVPAVEAREPRAGLPSFVTDATPAVRARVGGRCPWLGLGWDYVKEPREEVRALVKGIGAAARNVPRQGFTQFDRRIGHRLAKVWGLYSAD